MRATVTLDDELLELARAYTGIQATSALVQSALRQLVQKEAAKRLAGGKKFAYPECHPETARGNPR